MSRRGAKSDQSRQIIRVVFRFPFGRSTGLCAGAKFILARFVSLKGAKQIRKALRKTKYLTQLLFDEGLQERPVLL
jgi:hypothetical protein